MLSNDKNIINRKIILLQKGHSLATLAKETKYSVPSICKAITTIQKNSRDLHEAMTLALGVSLAEFWPELYGPDIVNKTNDHNNVTPLEFEKNLTDIRA